MEVEEYDAIGRQNNSYIRLEDSVTDLARRELTGHTWCDILVPAPETKVLARYESDYYIGKPALTRNRYGEGTAFYLGIIPEQQACQSLISWLVKEVGIQPLMNLPDGVEMTVRTRGAERFLFVLNHNDTVRQVRLPKAMYNLLNDAACGPELCLPAYELAILVER